MWELFWVSCFSVSLRHTHTHTHTHTHLQPQKASLKDNNRNGTAWKQKLFLTSQLHVNITLSPSVITHKSMSLFPSTHTHTHTHTQSQSPIPTHTQMHRSSRDAHPAFLYCVTQFAHNTGSNYSYCACTIVCLYILPTLTSINFCMYCLFPRWPCELQWNYLLFCRSLKEISYFGGDVVWCRFDEFIKKWRCPFYIHKTAAHNQ